MDAHGAGHNGSVDCDSITGSSHSKQLEVNSLARCFKTYVITLLMRNFLSTSLWDRNSSGLGISANSWLRIGGFVFASKSLLIIGSHSCPEHCFVCSWIAALDVCS